MHKRQEKTKTSVHFKLKHIFSDSESELNSSQDDSSGKDN